jgi:hypothetical protein
MICAYCGWRGKRYDCGVEEPNLETCPECGQFVVEERELIDECELDTVDFDMSLDIDNPQEAK